MFELKIPSVYKRALKAKSNKKAQRPPRLIKPEVSVPHWLDLQLQAVSALRRNPVKYVFDVIPFVYTVYEKENCLCPRIKLRKL